MNLEALFDAVIVRPIEEEETMYGSIVVPDAGKDRNEKGEVVEIKNRVNKLFNELRSYEKPQIMSYMWMNKTNKGYMVENLRKKEGNSMNIIEVDYDVQSDEFISYLKNHSDSYGNISYIT